MIISLILAVSENNIIGKNNQLVWHLPADMKFFRDTTMGHCIITGRKNYESIPEKFRPLPGRTNIVVTRQQKYLAPNAIVVDSIAKAIAVADEKKERECFIIGGAEIYQQTIGLANKIYLTHIHCFFEGDAYAPLIDKSIWKEQKRTDFQPDEKNKYAYSFIELAKV